MSTELSNSRRSGQLAGPFAYKARFISEEGCEITHIFIFCMFNFWNIPLCNKPSLEPSEITDTRFVRIFPKCHVFIKIIQIFVEHFQRNCDAWLRQDLLHRLFKLLWQTKFACCYLQQFPSTVAFALFFFKI